MNRTATARTRDVTIPSDLNAARDLHNAIEDALTELEYSEHDTFGIKMAVEEVIVNAIKHGNQMDPSKTVRVWYHVGPDRFEIRVTDQGKGFDPADVPDPTAPENIERPSGRGLFLIRHYMTEMRYEDGGRTCILVKVPGPRDA